MKQNGNVAANKIYNPKNRKPDIPLDADEVDSAMERYIRKKYQEKSLSDGKPLPPARNDPDTHYSQQSRNDEDTYNSRSPDNSPPPPLPPKKGRFFGFGLRAVSSAYPLSKHDKKNSPVEPRVDRAFRIGSENYNTASRSGGGLRMSEDDLQKQLIVLREMGFRDTQRNTALLRATGGDVERTIATLVKMDERGARSASTRITPTTTESTKLASADISFPSESEVAKSQTPSVSNNSFDQKPPGSSSTSGLSFAPTQQPQPTGRSYQSEPQGFQSNNPFGVPMRSQTDESLAQAFQSMQVSQPLFPHSTGGHPAQAQFQEDIRLQYSMSPPVPTIPQQYGYTASPTTVTNTNPFFQSGPATQNVGPNTYASGQQQQQPAGPSSNPFFQQDASFAPPQQPQQTQGNTGYNPFGIPPQHQLQRYSQQQTPSQSIFDFSQQPTQQAPQHQQQPQSSFNYSQQVQYQQGNPPQQTSSQQMPQTQNNNPYAQQQFQQQQQLAFQQQPNQYPPQFQTLPQTLMPQQTGRYDKSSILALYNFPQLAPQPPLASIPEPTEGQGTTTGEIPSQKRSATVPVSSMHSAGGGGNRNPFLSGPSTSMAQAPNGARHASAESVQINNLQNGRHSPDAFASLSARYMQ